MTLALPEDDISRRRARALAGAGLLATTYRPGVDIKVMGPLSSHSLPHQQSLPEAGFRCSDHLESTFGIKTLRMRIADNV